MTIIYKYIYIHIDTGKILIIFAYINIYIVITKKMILYIYIYIYIYTNIYNYQEKVFGKTQPRIEPQSSRPLANTLLNIYY